MNERFSIRAHCTGKSMAWTLAHPEIEPDANSSDCIEALTRRLEQGEPLAYLLERADFHDVSLKVNASVLVPRPETELLVELACDQIAEGAKVLELGTGSGAIALALAKARPDVDITATDVCEKALECARENARRLGQAPTFLCADWLAGIEGQFDAILSNPPYVAADDDCLTRLPLTFEPRHALDGGKDGLEALRRIVENALPRLNSGGMLALEHGFDQGEKMREMLEKKGYVNIATLHDLAGHERVSWGRRA